jgi:hypothetical protein
MSFLTLLTTVFFFSVFLFSCSLFRPSIPFSLYENFFDHLSLAPGIFKYRMYIIYEDVINLKAVHNVPTLILFSPFISFWFAEHNNAQSWKTAPQFRKSQCQGHTRQNLYGK